MRKVKKRVCMLLSGGFDSLILAHTLKEEGYDIDAIHVSYGQRNEKAELSFSRYQAHTLGLRFVHLELPKFSWSNSSIISDNVQNSSEEIPLRNLIFMSYALSYCAEKGIDRLYVAVYEDSYSDTKYEFMCDLGQLSERAEQISLYVPFIQYKKADLMYRAKKYGVTPKDFISCNQTTTDTPCGVCECCKILGEMYKTFS